MANETQIITWELPLEMLHFANPKLDFQPWYQKKSKFVSGWSLVDMRFEFTWPLTSDISINHIWLIYLSVMPIFGLTTVFRTGVSRMDSNEVAINMDVPCITETTFVDIRLYIPSYLDACSNLPSVARLSGCIWYLVDIKYHMIVSHHEPSSLDTHFVI